MYDVLVIGTGIAGLSAAVSAAQTGAQVALASAGKLFSGSSFYPGTWGLGLIAPVDDEDAVDLSDTIKRGVRRCRALAGRCIRPWHPPGAGMAAR